ncbi:hypothetical protein SH501x_000905 [Pirellulaceae bacterium SH501]
MADNEDDSVLFEVGVIENPQTGKRIERLAQSVEESQSRMQAGLAAIGVAAESVKGMMTGLNSELISFRDSSVETASQIRSAMSRIRAEASATPAMAASVIPSADGGVGSGVGVGAAASSAKELGDAAKDAAPSIQDLQRGLENVTGAAEDAGTEIDRLKGKADDPIVLRFTDELTPAMRNVLSELEGIAEEELTKVSAIIEETLEKLPAAEQQVTQKIRAEYEARMVAASEAYAAMAGDVDGYLAKEGSAAEKIKANMAKAEEALKGYADAHKEAQERVDQATVKGLRSSLQMVKGFAELGLMSEENTQKFMQSMAMIQGLFDIFEGGVDMLEAVSQGWKAVAKSADAANKIQMVEQSLQSARFVQMREYHAMLVQEAVLAKGAAAANNELNRSRNPGTLPSVGAGAGNVVGEVAGGVVGGRVATNVAAQGAGAAAAKAGTSAAVGAGGMLATVAAAGLATKFLLLAGAVVAATGAVVGLKEMVTGETGDPKSMSGRAGTWMAGTGAWAMEGLGGGKAKRGLAGFRGAIEVSSATSAIADLADSNIETKRITDAQKRRILQDQIAAEQASIERDAGYQIAQTQISAKSDMTRQAATDQSAEELTKMELGVSLAIDSGDLAKQQKIIDQFNAGYSLDMQAVGDAKTQIVALQAGIVDNLQKQSDLAASKGAKQLTSELEVQATIREAITKQEEKIAELKANDVTSVDEMNDAYEHANFLNEMLVGSLEKQRQIQSQTASERLAAEQSLQQEIRAQLDTQTARMQRLEEMSRNAGRAYVDMTDLERAQADAAVEKARAQGGKSLGREEKDLLSRVGTEETSRFVDEYYVNKQEELGFSKKFGGDIEAEKQQITATKSRLEAQLQASYDVSVSVQMDEGAIVNSVVAEAGKIMDKKLESITQQITQKMEMDKANSFQSKIMESRLKKQ